MMEPTPPSAEARWASRKYDPASPSSPSPSTHYALRDSPSLGSALPSHRGSSVRRPPDHISGPAVPRRVPRQEPLFFPDEDGEEAYDAGRVYELPDQAGEVEEGAMAKHDRGSGSEVGGPAVRSDGSTRFAPVGKLKRRKIVYRAEEEVQPVVDQGDRTDVGHDHRTNQAAQYQGNASRQAEDELLQHPQLDQTRQDPHPRLAARRPHPNAPIDRLAMRLQAEDDDVMLAPPALPEAGQNGRGIDRNGGVQTEDATPGAAGVGLEKGPGWEQQTILSIHCPNGYNIAAAVWDHEVRKMLVMEDTKDTTGFDLAALVTEQVQPDVVIMSARCQNELYDRIKKYCDQQGKSKIILQVHASFSDRQTVSALSQARLADEDASALPRAPPDPHSDGDTAITADDHDDGAEDVGLGKMRMALLKLGCRVNMEAPASRAAAGGLLVYIQKHKVLQANFDGEPGVVLEGIESLALHEHMLINQDALTSLGIFDVAGHAFSNNDRSKQTLSIFGTFHCPCAMPLNQADNSGLLNTCATTAGKRLFHTWHLRPLLSLQEIADRHNAVECLAAPDNSHSAKIIKKHMGEVKNVCRVMRLLRKGDGKVKDWNTLTKALMAFMFIRDQILGVTRSKPIPAIERVIRTGDGSMSALAQLIMNTIDWDMSTDEDRVCIRRGIDQELDRKREQLAELESHLDVISRKIAQTVDQNFFMDLKVQYLPQLGFLTAITPTEIGVPAPMGWETAFSTEHTHYYKNPQMRNMDDHFGDIETEIQSIELEIVQELVDKLRTVDTAVTVANDAVAELDCLIALAEAAIIYDLKRPIMRAEPILKIKDGRHLLQERMTESYIPNDTAMMGGERRHFSSMMIVTGANGSGKSVYGKQVALIAFMAQIGSFVPARSAEIGLVDKIFTRLQTKESAGRTGSAFMIDISQVAMALRGATERSLLILDEFGKGTTSTDGAGLLAAVIEHLQQGCFPRTIVLTHFHELFAKQIIPPQMDSVLFCHMRSILQGDKKRLTYQYRLEPGMSYSSNAAACARMYGIPEEVIERAEEVTECIATSNMAKIYEQEMTEEDYEEMTEAEELTKRFLQWDIDEQHDVKLILADMLDLFDQDMAKRKQDREGIIEEASSAHQVDEYE